MDYKYPLICIHAAGRTVDEVDDAAHDILGGNIEWAEIIGDYLVVGFYDHVGECQMLHEQIQEGKTVWYHIGMREEYEYWFDDPDYRPDGVTFFDKPVKQFELKHLCVKGKLIYSWKEAEKALAQKEEPRRSIWNRFWSKEKL